MFMQLHYPCTHYLSLGLPFFSSCCSLLPSFLFGLLPPLIDDHLTDVEPALKTGKGKKKLIRLWQREWNAKIHAYKLYIGSSKKMELWVWLIISVATLSSAFNLLSRKLVHVSFQPCPICSDQPFVGWTTQLRSGWDPKQSVSNSLPLKNSFGCSSVGVDWLFSVLFT